MIKIIFLNYIVIMSESTVKLLTNRIIKLELLLAYLIDKEKTISITKFNKDNFNNDLRNNINDNKWIQADKQISLDHIPYEHQNKLGIMLYNYNYIEPEEYINNIYNIIEKEHNEYKEAFELFEEIRVNSIIKEWNDNYKELYKKQQENYKKEQEKYKKEQEKYHEEELYKTALIQAKIQARIKAQEKLLEEEAMNELKNTTM